MSRAARAMAMATKKAMVTDGNNMDIGYCKEGDGRSTAATRGTARRTRPLVLRLEKGG
jgi:hypothetical protein